MRRWRSREQDFEWMSRRGLIWDHPWFQAKPLVRVFDQKGKAWWKATSTYGQCDAEEALLSVRKVQRVLHAAQIQISGAVLNADLPGSEVVVPDTIGAELCL